MVKGLEIFKNYFSNFPEQYVLIGGTACNILMNNVGLEFRSTKDLDIVLCVEALNVEFVTLFWQFIKSGDYKHQQKSTGKDIFYRFYSPNNPEFPVMLELFSRRPDTIKLGPDSHLTPIPVHESLMSLSAILLDNDYYHFIHAGKREYDGLPVVDAVYLIPLKARAWLDLQDRKNEGAEIDDKNIRKHKNDILRLSQLLAPNQTLPLSEFIKKDMQDFLVCLQTEDSIDLKNLGVKNTTVPKIIQDLKNIYGL